MAANVLLPLLIPLGEQLSNLTQLFGRDPVQFSQQQYNVTVSEDAPLGPILILKAITSPPDDKVHYSLLDGLRKGSSRWFYIDSRSGLLKLIKPLDYEKRKKHVFRVSAGSDRGSGETRVQVSVLDANDHAPVFSRLHYETQITEEDDRHLPKPVLQVQANDADDGRWGRVKYYIEGDGISTTESSLEIDHNNDNQIIQANDINSNHNNNNSDIKSRVFQSHRNGYSHSVGESAPSIINTLLQNNSSLILRSTFHKSLHKFYRNNSTDVSHIPAFTVDPQTGTVFVMKPLDRDAPGGKARWTLRVTATDGQLEATTGVQINLKDVNDNAPTFTNEIVEAAVPENAPAGTHVVTVEAIDRDDPHEANNAKMVYSLQKNVIDEESGRPIFTVDRNTGKISTALCCLDREHTGRYGLLLAATDGGGLQGTCTVRVEVRDVNDVPPRWALSEWVMQVPEGEPTGTVIAILPVTDPDRANKLAYRVVPESGQGWDLVEVKARADGIGAELKSLVPLDYENPDQRSGLHFQVQVTDQGEGSWADFQRVGVGTVSLQVLDTNDNPPVFESTSRQQAIEMSEDSPTGKILTTLVATDRDEGSGGLISYGIAPPSDPGGIFAVDTGGTVRLARTLDREKIPLHVIHVLAWDSGEPSNTSTATITVKVSDVNDNAPFLASPRVLNLPTQIDRGSSSKTEVAFNLKLKDPDDWASGNGPPFTISVDPEAQTGIRSFLKMKHKPGTITEGGEVVIPFTAVIEQDIEGALMVPLRVVDAGHPPQSSTVTLTLARSTDGQAIGQEQKFITVASVKSSGGIGLGRVKVDAADKFPGVGARYSWREPHSLFSMNPNTGSLTITADAPTGKYDLLVSVTDVTSRAVAVNISVNLYHISREDVTLATPIDIGLSNRELVTRHQQTGTSPLQRLLRAMQAWAQQFVSDSHRDVWNIKTVSIQEAFREDGVTPVTRLWLSAPHNIPPSVETLMHKYRVKIEEELSSNLIAVGVSAIGHCSRNLGGCKCCCQDKVVTGDNYILVDSKSSSHVGPTIHLIPYCGCASEKKKLYADKKNSLDEKFGFRFEENGSSLQTEGDEGAPSAHAVLSEDPPPSCKSDTCLNGGKCLPNSESPSKCICPSKTYGPRCKLVYREFNLKYLPENSGSRESWAVLPSLPTCSHLHITLHILTTNLQGLLFYTSDAKKASYNPFIALQVANGRPQLILRLTTSGSFSTITLNNTLNDNKWHRLDVLWRGEIVELISDLCSGVPTDPLSSSTFHDHYLSPTSYQNFQNKYPATCRQSIKLNHVPSNIGWGNPVFLGGRLVDETSQNFGLNGPPIVHSFSGCIAKVQINGKIQDLGYAISSKGSNPGCSHLTCLKPTGFCPINSRCVGSPGSERCDCAPGYAGTHCTKRTVPVSFKANSFIQLALSFTPRPFTTNLRLRVRSRRNSGQLVSLVSRHGRDSLTLVLQKGKLCLQLTLHPEETSSLCLKEAINDGAWHVVEALRQGSALELRVDEGENALYRASLSPSLHNSLLHVQTREGVLIGGTPEYSGGTQITVQNDLIDSCVDDIRLDGYPLPLFSSNGTSAGEVSVSKGTHRGCLVPPMCLNVTCQVPFTCQDSWRQNYCGCDKGFQVSRDGNLCTDINECVFKPCLNGGTCVNRSPGYDCLCSSQHSGMNCEHSNLVGTRLSTSMTVLLTLSVVSAIIAIILFIFLICYCYKRRKLRANKSMELHEDISSTNIPFDNINIEKNALNSTDLLCKLPEESNCDSPDSPVLGKTTPGGARKRNDGGSAESGVSVIDLSSATPSTTCEVHLNNLFDMNILADSFDQALSIGNPAGCYRKQNTSVLHQPRFTQSSKHTQLCPCDQPLPKISERTNFSDLPCTCGALEKVARISDGDILKIPSPQMFADPPDMRTESGMGHQSSTRCPYLMGNTLPRINIRAPPTRNRHEL